MAWLQLPHTGDDLLYFIESQDLAGRVVDEPKVLESEGRRNVRSLISLVTVDVLHLPHATVGRDVAGVDHRKGVIERELRLRVLREREQETHERFRVGDEQHHVGDAVNYVRVGSQNH
jgi:hypothetical protein